MCSEIVFVSRNVYPFDQSIYMCAYQISAVASQFILPFPIAEVTAKSNTLSSELKEEKSSLKKLKADYQQLQDDHSETKAEKEAAERVRILSSPLSFFLSLPFSLPPSLSLSPSVLPYTYKYI